MQKKQYIKEIPDFIKNGIPVKVTLSSIFLKFYMHIIWNKTPLSKKKLVPVKKNTISTTIIRTNNPKIYFANIKPQKNKQQVIEEYQKLKQDIYSYFCLMNEAQREYFFNPGYNRNPEYQEYTNKVELSTTKIVSGSIAPYMQEFQKDLEEKGIQLTYAFPLHGEVGFITATNKTRK